MELSIILCMAVACFCVLVIWYINGALVTPVDGENMDVAICLYPAGAAEGLEHTVSGLMWLIENGTLTGEIVIYNRGMDTDAVTVARILEKRYSRVHYMENLDSYGSGEGTDRDIRHCGIGDLSE